MKKNVGISKPKKHRNKIGMDLSNKIKHHFQVTSYIARVYRVKQNEPNTNVGLIHGSGV